MKLIRPGFLICSALATVWLVLCAVAGVVATEWALHPGRQVLSPGMKAQAVALAERDGATLTTVSISADDGVPLSGWAIRPDRQNGNAVILLHGVSDNRAGMLGAADLFLRRGYFVLLPDARAHGLSGGAIATYGIKESDDIRNWFEWIKQTQASHCIDGLGDSMGAAQLLQSLNKEPGFCAVEAESSFANFREASFVRMGQQIDAGAWTGRTLLRPAVEFGLLYVRWRYGVDLSQAAPDEAVASSRVPVLLIHGLKDTNLPPRNSEMIVAMNHEQSGRLVLWEPPEAGHCGAAGAEPREYERRVLGWFEGRDAAIASRSGF
jgi:dipeptidyl aminopeptidase/acylaminoacyl peptidase